MIQAEAKIDATHRLQDEGRWDEASIYRDEQRQKFRAEGLTRKESHQKAWETMSLKFPPPPDEGSADFFDFLSDCPRPCIGSKTSNFFSVYCSVRAELYRLCPTEMAQVDKPTTEHRLEPQTALPPGSSERTDDLLKYAFEHPVDFLAHCGDLLEGVADEIIDDDILPDILPELVAAIPAMQRIVQKRFIGALCP